MRSREVTCQTHPRYNMDKTTQKSATTTKVQFDIYFIFLFIHIDIYLIYIFLLIYVNLYLY